MDSYHVRSVIGKRLCLFCFGLFWQRILDENGSIVLLYMKNEVNSMVNILVADDDKNTRLLMKAILEGAGYHVTVAVMVRMPWTSWKKNISIWWCWT